jgi:hypothetical protein
MSEVIETGLYDPTHVGEKAAQGATMTNKQIAQAIRADIKAAKQAGEIPNDVKVSVRSNHLAVRIVLSGWTDAQVWERKQGIDGYARKEWTDEAAVVCYKVEKIRNAYNKECVNGMIDYFNVYYYGNTEWDWSL